MSARTARILLFVLIFTVVPLPMVFLGEGWVPGVRYLLFSGVVSAVMAVGGGAGPVPAILLVFTLHAVVAAALSFLIAHVLAFGVLRRLPPRAAGAVTLAAIVIGLGVALAFDLYQTPFGRAPRSNLIGILS